MQALTSTIAKYLFAVPFAIFGLFHFISAKDMAAMVPFGGGGMVSQIMVYLTGVALVAAAVSMIIGKMDKLSTLLLGAMLVIFAFAVHLPSLLGGNEMAMSSLLKDLALAGAAWMYSGYVAKDAKGMPA